MVISGCIQSSQDKLQDNLHPKEELNFHSNTPILFQDLGTELRSHLKNQVTLDSLLNQITHQENVTVIDKLRSNANEESWFSELDSSVYRITIEESNPSIWIGSETNSVFWDGTKKMNLNDYKVTCLADPKFRCESYGYNWGNYLQRPVIIKVGEHRFLYSNLGFKCNGIGCGCVLTLIYDLQYSTLTFLWNFRIPYSGFFLSDFNNDQNPDLLVIGGTENLKMRGLDLEEKELRLTSFTYQEGQFYPPLSNINAPVIGIDLYSFGVGLNHQNLTEIPFSIIRDNWPR